VVEGVSRRVARHALVIGVTVVASAVLAGCADGSPSAIDPRSPQARRIASLWWLMLALGGAIYLAVVALVVVSIVRRQRVPNDESFDPHDRAGRHRGPNTPFIIIGGLVVPALALAVVGVETVRATNAVADRTGTLHIDVEAEQWWWRVSYPDEGVVTANEIHLPTGVTAELTLRSGDVIHSLWVPQLNGKTDVVPGQTNHMTLTADEPGTYRGQCAEFCGIGHALMAFVVIAQPRADFDAWVAAQSQPATAPPVGAASDGRQAFLEQSCAGCHTVRGTSAVGTAGPDLTHFASRVSIAAGTLPNTADDLARWLSDTQGVKPGALMPQTELTSKELHDVVAYLEALR
jgi:cytochrome c oxidase subunit 2